MRSPNCIVPHAVYALAMRQFTRQQVVNAHAAAATDTHTHTHACKCVCRSLHPYPSRRTHTHTTAVVTRGQRRKKSAPTSYMILAPATIKYLTPLSRPERHEHGVCVRVRMCWARCGQCTHIHIENWEVGSVRVRCDADLILLTFFSRFLCVAHNDVRLRSCGGLLQTLMCVRACVCACAQVSISIAAAPVRNVGTHVWPYRWF